MPDKLHNRWVILFVLFVARLALGFQFQSVGSIAPVLVDDFSLDYSFIGLLIGIFLLPGIVLALPAGSLSRRMGDRRAVMFGLTLMVIGGVFTSMADTQLQLLAGRLISGSGAALLIVLMTKMVIDWFEGKELFIAMGIFIVGWPVGIAAGQTVLGGVADAVDWRFAITLTTVLCLAAFVLFGTAYEKSRKAGEAERTNNQRLTGDELLLIHLAGIAWMFLNGAYFVVLSFGPTLLLERGYSILEAGAIVSCTSWAFVIGLPLGGILSTRFRAPNTIMMTGLGAAAVIGSALPFFELPVIGFAQFGFAMALATPIVAAIPSRVLRPEVRARGLGYYFSWFFGGVSILPMVGGYLKDTTGSAWSSLLFGASLALGCLMLVALVKIFQSRISKRAPANSYRSKRSSFESFGPHFDEQELQARTMSWHPEPNRSRPAIRS